MRRLYHEDIGPDGQVLRPQRKAKYPVTGRNSMYERIEAEVEAVRAERGRFFTPEEERKLRLQLRSAYRTSVPFYDMTFSAPKSVSVLWASLLAASAEAAAEGREADAERLAAEAEQIRGAVRRANDRMIAVLERGEAYIRTGHHSAHSGEYRDADGFIVASFPQHDSRDGDPQLHVHNAIANLAQRADEADERWRALHAQPLFRNKGRYSTLAERYLGQELELLGLRTVLRAGRDGAGDWRDHRRGDGRVQLAEQGAAGQDARAGDGVRGGARPRSGEAGDVGDQAAGDHRDPRGQAARCEGSGAAAGRVGAASSAERDRSAGGGQRSNRELRGGALAASAARRGAAGADHPQGSGGGAGGRRHLEPGAADFRARPGPSPAARGRGSGGIPQRPGGRGRIGPGRGRQRAAGVAPRRTSIDVTRLPFRKDGTSIYRPPGEERFCTAEHRDHEQYLVDIAVLRVPQRVTAEAAAAALAGTQLDYSQREACAGLLSSARLINCLEAPAGTGKTHVMAEFARVWEEQRAGRMIGVTTTTNAARVMAGEAAQGRDADGDLQHRPVPRQDQGFGRDARHDAAVPR